MTNKKEKILASIMTIASENDIQMAQASYQPDSRAGEPIQSLHINLSFNTTFDHLKSFIYNALISNAYLSLDELRISRNHIDDSLLDIHMIFTMYLKNEK